jgi:DNA helicase-2/ATP-dependent DNA helicase PcrA
MRLVADLHVHSRWSRATSREADLDGFHRWARVKGIDIVGTGDFTHPAWLTELSARLVEKEGLFELREAPRDSPLEGASPADRDVRFMLTAEISSIYKKRGRVRKMHSLIGVKSLEDARRLGVRLSAVGNIASDGRPILGLDPKDLLSMLLETAEDGFLIPAHVWTPWFSLFGSRSGFDRLEECFEDLTPHIFALETGLSSDPRMNRRWSALDRYRLVSNSDAHSPRNLGREANLLDTDPSWQGVTAALRTGTGFRGTTEFYPEEGKYHYDGHRKCGVCMDPEETIRAGGKCPVCGTPLTVGVLSRVLQLADRAAPAQPREGEGFQSLIPLTEILAELAGTGTGSRAVQAWYARLIGAFGSEYALLLDAPVAEIVRSHVPLLGEAIRRMREGRTNSTPGCDGEFGVIRVFEKEELARLRGRRDSPPSLS